MLRAIVYLWTFPTSACGLIFLALAWMGRGQVKLVEGVFEVTSPFTRWFLTHCTALPGGARAMTLGHIVIGVSEEALNDTRAHERVHVRQAERWGPFFIPAYLLTSLYLKLTGKDPYHDNPFEREAFERT